jgi:hypothetical protein
MKKMIAQVMMRMQVLVKMKIRKHQEEKMIVGGDEEDSSSGSEDESGGDKEGSTFG